MNKEILRMLNTEICYIFDNEESFLTSFGKGDWMDLIEVSFTSYYIKIVYLLCTGQHVADSILIEDYLQWKKVNKCHIKEKNHYSLVY